MSSKDTLLREINSPAFTLIKTFSELRGRNVFKSPEYLKKPLLKVTSRPAVNLLARFLSKFSVNVEATRGAYTVE